MRHMMVEQAEARLRSGKALEQWLGREMVAGRFVLRWVRLSKEAEQRYVVTLYEAIESDRAKHDIYGLHAVERDEYGALQQVFGAGNVHESDSARNAMAVVLDLGGTSDRFVSDGLVQDEYLSLVAQ